MNSKWVNLGPNFMYKILLDKNEKISSIFMRDLFKNYIKKNIEYNKKTGDWIFYYGEVKYVSGLSGIDKNLQRSFT